MPNGFNAGYIYAKHYFKSMVQDHDPPEAYQFNNLRKAGGSNRLTLVKASVENADIDPSPPRPRFAQIPAGGGVWIGFDIARYESQLDRVRIRHAVTEALLSDTRIVGEYSVPIQGKLGSAVILVPRQLVETLDLDSADRVTNIAIAPGILLFVTETKSTESPAAIETAIDAARQAVSE